MRTVLSSIGKFHFHDLGQQMNKLGHLERIYTGYPRWKLSSLQLPASKIQTYPWIHTPYMALQKFSRVPSSLVKQIEYLDKISFDRYTARTIGACDIFTGISGSALHTGRKAQSLGAKYVCDRGSSHIRYQDAILREEYKKWGMKFDGIDPRIIALEEAEYAQADLITVPSTFALNSFVKYGIRRSKLSTIPYGVEFGEFFSCGEPESSIFQILFVGGMSIRKGIPYLLAAFSQLRHTKKRLTFVGQPDYRLIARMKEIGLWPDDACIIGHVPQNKLAKYYSTSDVLVLPSVEDGFGLVVAQALACGCPVIASTNTGASELIQECENGFVVPPQDSRSLNAALQRLADSVELRRRLREAAPHTVKAMGGWDQYGSLVAQTYRNLLQ